VGGQPPGRLEACCRRHGLAPLLYWYLCREAKLEPSGLQALEWDYQRNVEHNQLLQARLADFLGASSHPVMVLGGAALDAYVYPQAGLRSLSELDVLVSPEDIRPATALLKKQGYRLLSQSSFQATYEVGEPQAQLHLHWSLGWGIPLPPLFQAARALPFHDSTALALHPHDLLLVLAWTIWRRGFDVPLQSLWDLAECCRAMDPGERSNLPERAAAWGLGRCLCLLGKTLDLFGLPDPFASPIEVGAGDHLAEATCRVIHHATTGRQVDPILLGLRQHHPVKILYRLLSEPAGLLPRLWSLRQRQPRQALDRAYRFNRWLGTGLTPAA